MSNQILSQSALAREVSVSEPTIRRLKARGTIVPDFVSDDGIFYAASRLPELRQAILSTLKIKRPLQPVL